jgi:hypothetical protein
MDKTIGLREINKEIKRLGLDLENAGPCESVVAVRLGKNKYRIYDDWCEVIGTGAECLRELKVFKNI